MKSGRVSYRIEPVGRSFKITVTDMRVHPKGKIRSIVLDRTYPTAKEAMDAVEHKHRFGTWPK